MIRTNRTHHRAIAIAVGLVLAACGGDEASDETVDESTPARTGAPTTSAGTSTGTAASPTTSGSAPSGAAIDPALVAAAEEEGEVTVYSFTSRIAEVEATFEAAYPGIDLIGVDISATEQIERIRAEVDAGAAGADVAYVSDAPVVLTELVEGGYLEQYIPVTAADALPDEYESPLAAHRLSTKVVMYNEEAYPDGPPIDNLWDLTTEEWTGNVVMVDPLQRGDYLDLMTQIAISDDEMATAYETEFGEPIDDPDNAGDRWIEDLLANDVVLSDDTDNVNAAVGAVGQEDPPIGITSYSDRRDNEDEGWALQVAAGVEPSPGIVFPAYLAPVKDSPNPNAAKLLIEYMFGDGSETGGPAYEPFYVPGDYPTRDDISDHPDSLPLDELGAWVIDPQEIADARDDVADLVLSVS